jgi:hypothetical protein
MTEKEMISLEKCISFLDEIGVELLFDQTAGGDFLPGLSIHAGKLIVDKQKLLYPGDILHEAGHIAVVPAAERSTLNADAIAARPQREAEEMCTIAWSYAAAVHLKLEPAFVFHEDGYKGGGNSIAENFIAGRYIGLPMLQWIGLAADEKNAAELDVPAYPAMIKWLRD